MAKVSISRAWDETRGVVRRDGKLIASVAAAFIVLPGVVAGLFQPEVPAGQLPPLGLWSILTAVAGIVSLVGQLAIIRLAIGPSLSVGEAIRHGIRRLLPLLIALLLVLAPVMVLALGLAQAVGEDATTARPLAALLLLLVLPLFLFLVIRLILVSPVASAEDEGPLGIIKRSWALTRGNWWRLFGFFVLWFITAIVVAGAGGAVFGTLATLVFGDVEGVSVGALLLALVMEILMAALTILLTVMLARVYVQLAGGGPAEASVPTTGT